MDDPSPTDFPALPVVVHLSGRLRGTTERLSGQTLRLGTGPEADLHFPADREPAVAPEHAVLRRQERSWELAPIEGNGVWVNGERLDAGRFLTSEDLLEIGEGGPILRFRLYPPGGRAHKSMAEAFTDCVDCARFGAETSLGRAAIFARQAPRELATQTSPALRAAFLGVLLLLVLLSGATGMLFWKSQRLEQRLELETSRVEGLASLLAASEAERLDREELAGLRAELDARVAETEGRVTSLEQRAVAGRTVISEAARSVVFLQGAFGFLHEGTGKPLRYLTGPDGEPLVGASGEPRVGLDGDGPVVESLYTGSGFVVTEDGLLLTNRHVAEPWHFEASADLVIRQGFVPVMRRFVGYLPGTETPFEVELVAASDEADVAVLRCSGVTGRVPALPLAEAAPRPGDEVLVLGYPTGIQALLARAGDAVIEEVVRDGDTDFWGVARHLARRGGIGALATRGIVGQVTEAAVVYDAETTSGGSGGPVMNLDGQVVAVNTAILPEFGGSNLGVPAARAGSLLATAREAAEAP